jgi:uncharacterized membrane protein YtjA (UPF0391 family)
VWLPKEPSGSPKSEWGLQVACNKRFPAGLAEAVANQKMALGFAGEMREGLLTWDERRISMLGAAILFFLIALAAAFFGFSGIAGTAAWIAWVMFVVFVVLFVLSLIVRLIRGGSQPQL